MRIEIFIDGGDLGVRLIGGSEEGEFLMSESKVSLEKLFAERAQRSKAMIEMTPERRKESATVAEIFEPYGCPTPGACSAIAELTALRVQVEKMAKVMQELADDLEAELNCRYSYEPNGEVHPAERKRYERDMMPVHRARSLLAEIAPF